MSLNVLCAAARRQQSKSQLASTCLEIPSSAMSLWKQQSNVVEHSTTLPVVEPVEKRITYPAIKMTSAMQPLVVNTATRWNSMTTSYHKLLWNHLMQNPSTRTSIRIEVRQSKELIKLSLPQRTMLHTRWCHEKTEHYQFNATTRQSQTGSVYMQQRPCSPYQAVDRPCDP